MAVILVLEFTVKLLAFAPLNWTAEASSNAFPVMTTDVPEGPLVGVNELTVGGLELLGVVKL